MDLSKWRGAPRTSLTNHLALVRFEKTQAPSQDRPINEPEKTISPKVSELNTKDFDSPVNKDACGVGVYAKLNSPESHEVLTKSLTMLARMDHRGAVGNDPQTSDGVGIMTEIPHVLLAKDMVNLPPKGEYALAHLFVPHSVGKVRSTIKQLKEAISLICYKHGYDIIGWRKVHVNKEVLGPNALKELPNSLQFAVKPAKKLDEGKKNSDLYLLIRSLESSFISMAESPFIVSMSYETVVYKALCLSKNLKSFTPILQTVITAPDMLWYINVFQRILNQNGIWRSLLEKFLTMEK